MMQRPARRRRRLLLAALAALLAVFLPLAWNYYQLHLAEAELAALLAQLDAKEPGWRDAAMPIWPNSTYRGRNVAQLRELLAQFSGTIFPTPRQETLFQRALSRPGKLLTNEDRAVLRSELEPQAAFIKQMLGAPSEPGDFTDDDSALRPIRHAQDRLLAQLLLELQGPGDAVAPILETAWSIAEALRYSGPAMAGYFVRMIHRARVLDRFEHALTLHAFKADELRIWQERLLGEADAAEAVLPASMAFERARFQRWSLEMETRPAEFQAAVKELYGQPHQSTWRTNVAVLDGLLLEWLNRPPLQPFPAEVAGYLRYQCDVLAVLRQPIPIHERMAKLKAINDTLAQRPLYTRLMMPSFDKTLAVLLRAQATHRALALLLACERYRLDQGGWPSSAAALTPNYLAQVPLDPYTHTPLFFTRNKQGIQVKVVGPLSGPKYLRLLNPELRRLPAEMR